MKQVLKEKNLLEIPRVGDTVDTTIVGKGRAAAFVDLGLFGTGIIYGREFQQSKDELKDLEDGDTITVKIIALETEDGYVECSRIQARKELAWGTLQEKKDNKETLIVKIEGANKGGLLTKVSGIPSFIPSSQLSSENYPRVEGGDTSKILKELQSLVGKELEVKILDLSKEGEKLILSERTNESEQADGSLKDHKEGDVVEGEVTGIVDFGAFVRFGEGIEGLIHISEMNWSLVENPREILKEGEKIKAKIIKIDNGKVFLSLKALKSDPWKEVEKNYKSGDIIEGTVTKFISFGAFVEIESGIQGLCHISEFQTREKMEEALEVGKSYKFKILSINASDHRLGLRLIEK